MTNPGSTRSLISMLLLLFPWTAFGQAPSSPPEVERARVGIYLKQLPQIDVKSNTYKADFYAWFLYDVDRKSASVKLDRIALAVCFVLFFGSIAAMIWTR